MSENLDNAVEVDESASPKGYVDKSVDTSIPEQESDDTPPEEEAEEESEADPSPAVEEDDDEKTDPQPGDIEYTKAVKERIDKLTERFRESERSLTSLEQENADLKRQLSEVPVQREAPKTVADFDYDESKYRDYLFDEAQKLARQTVQEEMSGLQKKTEQQTLAEKFAEKEKAFAEKMPDYHKKVYDPDLKISGAMVDEAQRSDLSTEILYYLASNPDEAAEMYRKPEREVIRSMFNLESKLRVAKEAPVKKVSEAPPPPPKIKAGDPGIKKDPADMSDKEFAKWRRRQIARR
jgi:hypothetical protein